MLKLRNERVGDWDVVFYFPATFNSFNIDIEVVGKEGFSSPVFVYSHPFLCRRKPRQLHNLLVLVVLGFIDIAESTALAPVPSAADVSKIILD